MKLSSLIGNANLIEIKLDTDDLVKEFGEAISFKTFDQLPLKVFLELAESATSGNTQALVRLAQKLILDDAGKPMLTDESTIPQKVLLAAVEAVTARMGK